MQRSWNSVLPAGDAHTRIYPPGPCQHPAIPGVAVMEILIPTRGRIYQQLTLQSLPPELRKRTTLVCPKREASELHRLYENVKIACEPYPNMKIAQKREWIAHEWLKYGHEKILMIDDDLVFSARISADDWHLREIQGEELIPEFQRIEDKLGPEYPHVGFGQRQGNNHETAGWKSPGKMVCTLGYYLPVVVKECQWDLVELRQDMCVTLQLLLKGYANAVWTRTVADQKRDAPGGCSTYRTDEMSAAEARKLAALFPNYVSVGKRKYGRLEVTVQWQKALRDGQRNRSRLFVC
jgi:hypothetical protein